MINYDLTKIRAIIFDVDGVLSKQTITMDDRGVPLRTANIRDGYAIQLAVKMGLKIAIMTGGNTDNVRQRYEYLGLEDVYMGCSMKIDTYTQYRSKYALNNEEIIYMGDDIPDLPVMRLAGCPVCPADAAPEVKEESIYISHFNGGEGCGRDIIEQVMRAQGLWMTDVRAFTW